MHCKQLLVKEILYGPTALVITKLAKYVAIMFLFNPLRVVFT